MANFNWDVFLDKIIKSNIKLCNYANLAVVSDNVYVTRDPKIDIEDASNHKALRNIAQIFEIDDEMGEVLGKLGQEYIKYNAQEEVLKLIRLPYESVILQYYDKNSDIFMSLFAQHSEFQFQYAPFDPKFIFFEYYIANYSEKRRMYTARFIDDSKGIFLNKFSNDPIYKNNLFGMESEHVANRLHALLMIIGFCIALNTKCLYKEETVFSKKSNYHCDGKEYIVKEHGYKKLKLSLKGKQHLQYIREKYSGSANKSRQHLRRGHFKQRKTGLFWWNPHISCKESEYSIEKSYKVTA